VALMVLVCTLDFDRVINRPDLPVTRLELTLGTQPGKQHVGDVMGEYALATRAHY
jgi:hypothetical protein